VLVGSGQTRFVVHENLLIYYSKFFRAALTGNFIEAKDKTVRLEEVDPKVFELFIHWLYYQRFPKTDSGDDRDILETWNDDDIGLVCTSNYVLLYIFGDKYDVPELRRATVDGLLHDITMLQDSNLPNSESMSAAFSSLPVDSPMSRLIIECFCRYSVTDLFDDLEGYNNVKFLQALWRRFCGIRRDTEEDDESIQDYFTYCDYHEHESEDERAACTKARKGDK
jgi:hypothetical protein